MKKSRIKGTNEFCYYEKLDNGLDIYMVPNKKVDSFYFTLTTRFGSVDIDYKIGDLEFHLPNGIAHFLEHLKFHMPNEDAFDHYRQLGSSVNAHTEYEFTSYIVKANKLFKENLSYLIEYVYTPYFTEELVEKEKGIIAEEVKMYEDNPDAELTFGLYKNIFINDNHQYFIGGTVEDVYSTTLEDVKNAYEAFYNPNNMLMTITGNFDIDETLKIIKDTFNSINIPKYQQIDRKEIVEPYKVNYEYIEEKMNVDKTKINYALKIPKKIFSELKLTSLELKMYLNLILDNNFGSTSLFKEEIINKNIITDDLEYSVFDIKDYLIAMIIGQTNNKDEFIKSIRAKLKNLSINQTDLNRMIKVNISSLILMFDNIVITGDDIVEGVIRNGKYIYNYGDLLKKMNVNTANNIISKLDNHLESILVIKPKDE